ncbi:MAG: hypothetical protein PHD05_00535 [Sphaerochaetaceae bacterium]|nr:hypothetical protein [Sphaerochaetaceae bacterium]
MGNLLIKKLIQFLGAKFDGYKTKATGLSAILLGLVGLLGYAFPDQNLPQVDIEYALGAIALGGSVLGNGGKQEKIKDELARILEELQKRPLG